MTMVSKALVALVLPSCDDCFNNKAQGTFRVPLLTTPKDGAVSAAVFAECFELKYTYDKTTVFRIGFHMNLSWLSQYYMWLHESTLMWARDHLAETMQWVSCPLAMLFNKTQDRTFVITAIMWLVTLTTTREINSMRVCYKHSHN